MSDAQLFTYGTLREAHVQQALFGRTLAGIPATLTGFAAETIAFDDHPATDLGGGGTYPILRRSHDPADRIDGLVLTLTAADLTAADAYETDAYARVSVTLADGSAAQVYAHPEEWLDDLHPGLRRSFGHTLVDRDEVIAFATRFDPQPFHLSEAAAARTHFGRLSASGWHTCAMAMAMIVAEMRARGHQGLGAAGIDELRWTTPVHPGDTLRCESEVLSVTPSRSRPEMGSFVSRMTVFNQHDAPVCTLVSRGLARRRPHAAE